MAKQVGFNELFNKASFDQGVNELVIILSKITTEIQKAETAGKNLATALGQQLKNDISSLSSSSSNLSKEISTITTKMDQFKATTVQIDKVTKEYEKEVTRLKNELDKLKQSQANVNAETEKAGKVTNSAKNSFAQLSQSLVGIASGATLVHRAISIFKDQLSQAIDSTLEFEKAMKAVQAVSRSSADELELLTNNANKLGATTEKTAGQVAKLQLELAKLGFDPTEILAVTKSIVDLSTATGEDVVKAGTVAAATLRAFGLESVEMSRVTDVMTGSFVRSALDLEKFRESMKLVAPIAAATGVELEVVTASLSKLADTGIFGSLAGTAMRNLLSSMADPTEDLTKLLGKLDSSLADGIKSSEDFSRALVVLKKSNIDLETAVQMVDVRARSAFFTLVEQADAIGGLTLEYKILNGETQEIARVMRDTLSNDIDIANSAFDALRRNIVEQFIPTGRDLMQTLAILSEYFRFLVIDISSASKESDKFFAIMQKNYGIFQPFVDLWKSFIEGAEDTVIFRRSEEEMGQLGLELNRTGISLKSLSNELNLFNKTSDMLKSKDTAGIFKMLEEAGSDYADILVSVKEGTLTNEEATNLYNFRLKESIQTTKEQYEIHKQTYQQLLKNIKTNNTFRDIEREKLGEAINLAENQLTEEQKASKKKIDMMSEELFDMGRKKIAYEEFFKLYKEEEKLLKSVQKANKGLFDRAILDKGKEELQKQNKILQDKLKLENDLSEVSLKRAIELAKLDAKTEKDPIKKLEIQKQTYLLQIELAKLRYKNEVKILDQLYKDDANILLKREKAYQNYVENINKVGDDFLSEQIDFQNNATKNLSKAVEDATKKGHDSLKKLAKDRIDQISKDKKTEVDLEEEKWDKIQNIAQEAAQGLSQITRFIFDNQQVARENEMNAVDAWEKERIRLAGDNQDAIAAIEREAEERRKKIRIEQAKADKKEAIFQILIQTAVNVVKAFGNPLKMILAGAVGAAQAALVAARPLPQFAKGTNNSPGGLAIVGEKGSELIVDGKTGKPRLSPDRPSITSLSKGSQVIPAHITHKLLTDPSFDYNGVAEKHLNKAQSIKIEKEQIDYSRFGAEMRQAVKDIPINQTNFDERGVTNYVVKRNVRLRRLNKRY